MRVLKIGLLAAFAIGVVTVAAPGVSFADPAAATKEAKKRAAIINRMHSKASKAIVNYAQDKTFQEYFGADDAGRKALKPKIDELSLKVQAKFDVAEMCLIDDKGHEHSRIVGNAIAPDADLSTEEASAPFFAPTFAKPVKEVFVSPVYMSPDAEKWVIAYVTPIEQAGKKSAILHYEHLLTTYQDALAKGANGRVLAVDANGFVVADSAGQPATALNGDKEDPADYFTKLGADLAGVVQLGGSGNGSAGGKSVAFEPVADWTIVVIQ